MNDTNNAQPDDLVGRFDIVWFTNAHEKRAMLSLKMLPGGEAERLERYINHHYRGWQNVPAIDAEGKRAPGFCWCVATGHPGSAALRPGAIVDGKIYTAQFCAQLVEIAPGFIGGVIRPETWSLPEFKTAADKQLAVEERARNKAQAALIKKAENIEAQRENAIAAYFETVALMVLPAGCEKPQNLERVQLQNLSIMAVMMGVKLPTLESWLNEVAPVEEMPEEKPYDPLSFLAYGQQIQMTANVVRQNGPSPARDDLRRV